MGLPTYQYLLQFSSLGFSEPGALIVSAPHFLCLEGIVAGIQALGLQGIDSANVATVKLPMVDVALKQNIITGYPAVLVCPWGQEGMDVSQGTNLRDDVEYPCLVNIIQANETDLRTNLNRYLRWRHVLLSKFRNQHLALPNGLQTMTVRAEPNMIVVPEAWTQGFYHSAFVLRAVIREARG